MLHADNKWVTQSLFYNTISMCLESPQSVIWSKLPRSDSCNNLAVFPRLFFKLPVSLSSQAVWVMREEGNHRQWCGPLQGKPRYGGIPLRKSTPSTNDCSYRSWDRPGLITNHIIWFIHCKRFCPISVVVIIAALTPLVYLWQGRFLLAPTAPSLAGGVCFKTIQ